MYVIIVGELDRESENLNLVPWSTYCMTLSKSLKLNISFFSIEEMITIAGDCSED